MSQLCGLGPVKLFCLCRGTTQSSCTSRPWAVMPVTCPSLCASWKHLLRSVTSWGAQGFEEHLHLGHAQTSTCSVDACPGPQPWVLSSSIRHPPPVLLAPHCPVSLPAVPLFPLARSKQSLFFFFFSFGTKNPTHDLELARQMFTPLN